AAGAARSPAAAAGSRAAAGRCYGVPAGCGEGGSPFLEHPAEVLTADGFDEAPPDSIRAELGQGPTAVGETNHGGWVGGESAEGGPVRCGDPGRRPPAAPAAYPGPPPARPGQ